MVLAQSHHSEALRGLAVRNRWPEDVLAHRIFEWRRWIAESIMLGVNNQQMIAALVRHGCPFEIAKAEIDAAAGSPYVEGGARLSSRIAKRDWLLNSYAKLQRLVEPGCGVEKRDRLDPGTFLREHYAAHRPVILTGMIEEWPAMCRWSLDDFQEKLGDALIEVQMDRDQDPQFELNSLSHKRHIKFGELIERLREDPTTNDFYVTANNGGHNRKALASLWGDFGELPGFLDPRSMSDGFFWMGPRGTITPWHHDLTNNFLVQIRGRKRVRLASATQSPKMRNHWHCFSEFGARGELSDLPESDRPRVVTCDLEPGEILFIPVGWWHHVEALDMTIGASFINFVWDNDFSSTYCTYEAV